MDLKSMLNKGGNAAAAQLQYAQQQASQRTHMTEGTQPGAMAHQPLHALSNAAHAQNYAQGMPMMAQGFQQQQQQQQQPLPNGFAAQHAQDAANIAAQSPTGSGTSEQKTQVKAFGCSTCGKGFARRSDLARHERIHSGHRPHVCDWPGCGKEFIQRSALTVHTRVHTGEKPHMCEHCTKPFSDSSSLARHRRIHSGKRPYKCPYANCQKTFTRRTTLTRHQNSHTGTVEESARATAAALASRPVTQVQRTQSESGAYSDGSNRNTPSPGANRPVSMSPTDMHVTQTGYGYLPTPGSGSLPPHMRSDYGSNMHSPRSSPGTTSPALSGFGQPPTSAGPHHAAQIQARQPAITSHPGNFGPPQPMEPAPTQERTPNGSPHMTQSGWQSPSGAGFVAGMQTGIQPAMQTGMQHAHAAQQPHEQYGFDQYSAFQAAPHMYGYANSHMRRPQATGPTEVWSGQTYA